MEDRCICCGAIIPEGIQVCPKCEEKSEEESVNKKVVIMNDPGR